MFGACLEVFDPFVVELLRGDKAFYERRGACTAGNGRGGIQDDLVEKETTLAPLDYIDAEVSPFPKGHVAIAVSWSNPKSACALHTRFGDQNYRGPVRYQLDLDAELDRLIIKSAKRKGKTSSMLSKTKSTVKV